MATEEEKDINVTFPENYGVAELAGQPVVFHVKVDGIKEKVLPELNDEFVGELKISDDVKTVDDLTKHLKEQMKEQRKAEAEQKATDALLDQLCEVCKVDIPEIMIDDETDQTFAEYRSRITQQGLNMDMYYRIMGTDEKGFKEQLRPEAEKKTRIRLVLDAIADDMKIAPTAEEINEEYEAMAKTYGMEVDKIRELAPESYVTDDLKIRKVLDTLKKENKKSK